MAKKSDGSEYTVSSLLSAIRVINRFYNSNISKVKPVDLYDKKVFPNKILIPANNPKIIADYEKYFSKRPVDADPGFYLYPIDTKSAPDYSLIKVWYKKTQLGQLKLKTFMKVLAKKTDIGANDYKVFTITRYQALSGIASYERPKDGVQKFALSNLMNAIDSNIDKMISQNQPSTTLLTKDFIKILNLHDKFIKQILSQVCLLLQQLKKLL
ncbi:zinc finger mym-type protein 2-like [Gigaspora margarita]|uniref:Zinc finger mym-type protein 2-like n=1 Tax=Gigaspora margarita TaxID=4874 RepID=A0A8H4AX63_GIGMA|nr:zinc finger mym-type protein 2-like [Gigaspora margarita]